MVESTFLILILKFLLAFGLLVYTITTSLCIYISLVGQIMPNTTWYGKAKIYYGFGNMFFWGAYSILLAVIKLGGLLL